MYFANFQRGLLEELQAREVSCFQFAFLACRPWWERCHCLAQKFFQGLKAEASAGVMNCLAVGIPVSWSVLSLPIHLAAVVGNCVCCTAVAVRAADTLAGRDGWVVTWAGDKKLLVQALLGVLSCKRDLGISAGVWMSFLCSTAPWNAVWSDWECLKKAWENEL